MAKLLVAIVHEQDAGKLTEALRAADLRLTEVNSRGGFLKSRNVMIFIGLDDDQLPLAMSVIEENCTSRTVSVPMEMLGGMEANWLPAEVQYGGATVFVVPLDEVR
ncbi:MAG TPA: cyclic-di-AMP receptor, partial [Candidatus Limnocylindria bacterium]|nr:cyclic-di-AMP receptor [Candidatus Limnocylindria bacterium]